LLLHCGPLGRSKLTKLKVKEEAAKKEKDALKQAMKKNHVILK